jgi:hypothetical protein
MLRVIWSRLWRARLMSMKTTPHGAPRWKPGGGPRLTGNRVEVIEVDEDEG